VCPSNVPDKDIETIYDNGRYARDRQDDTIVLVTHGGPSVACYHYLTGSALEGGSTVVPVSSFHIFKMDSQPDVSFDTLSGEFLVNVSQGVNPTHVHSEQADNHGGTQSAESTVTEHSRASTFCGSWGGWHAVVTANMNHLTTQPRARELLGPENSYAAQ